MATPKAPLLSMGARGSIGDTISFARRRHTNIAERKPIPTIRHTLPQTYQRWLWQDYAHYWTLQSIATRQSYQSLGSRQHLTGFQYWMSYHLDLLPDIAGYWKLDSTTGAIALDSGRNENHGTIIGAVQTPGLIAEALSFDGVNDFVGVDADPTVDLDELTVEAFVYTKDKIHSVRDSGLIGHGNGRNQGYQLAQLRNAAHTTFKFKFMTDLVNDLDTVYMPVNSWHHILYTQKGTDKRGYLDGVFFGSKVTTNPIVKAALPLHIGRGTYGGSSHGYQDQTIIYNRILDDLTIARHAERRFAV